MMDWIQGHWVVAGLLFGPAVLVLMPWLTFPFVAVGIVGYRVVEQPGKPYVIATRRDGLRDLHIYHGATNGCSSEDEVIRIAGDAVGRRESGSRKGTWCVLHPVNQARPAGKRSKNDRRDAGICGCGMQRSLTGVCDSCD